MKYRSLIVVALLITLTASSMFASINAANSIIKGKLLITGNAPFTKLICQTDTQKYILTGELLVELTRIQGANVQLEGSKNIEKFDLGLPVFQVMSYKILSIGEGHNKKVPWVGIVKEKGDQLYLEVESNKLYQLEGTIIFDLRKHLGSKVWITGKTKPTFWFNKKVIIPDAYQIIREGSSH